MAKLNTANPDHLIYANSLLTTEVLGGVRLEGLDRMRVTLKVSLNQSEIPPLRHNLDLYNDTQLEKFIRKTALRCGNILSWLCLSLFAAGIFQSCLLQSGVSSVAQHHFSFFLNNQVGINLCTL